VAGDFDDGKSYHNGQKHFEPIYRSASPVDFVVMALGTNDVDDGLYERHPNQIVDDILWYENKSKKFLDEDEVMPTFVYVLPPNFSGLYNDRGRMLVFNKEKREVVNSQLKKKSNNFVEINDIDLSEDGLHFSPAGHQQMAGVVYDKIKELEGELA
jgi:lysophospholipase L1-like esterase